ncbi:unnamed protein product [Urochloa decumbens]|uniref:Late embryogenesis abundant protein LEA-2 subgroup domain-containing protein n=1 Tax=Urochloa decumbens TaxID=240449 RepID=A0ABC8ZSH7_9POAL
MDLEALLSGLYDEEAHKSCIFYACMAVLFVISAVFAPLIGYDLLFDPRLRVGRIKFSMEPVACTGLGLGHDGAAPPPLSFNVTLHATSTFRHTFCSSGGATLQAAFSGLTVAVGQVAPFCLEPREPAVIAGTAASAWTALPHGFQERIDRGREKSGGLELEVNLSFKNEFKGEMWMRCRAMLDANLLNKTACTTFIRTPFIYTN